jgi:hypothetical protein
VDGEERPEIAVLLASQGVGQEKLLEKWPLAESLGLEFEMRDLRSHNFLATPSPRVDQLEAPSEAREKW